MKLTRPLALAMVLVVTAYAAVKFTSKNSESVSIDLLLVATPELPLWAVVLGVFGCGVLCGMSLLVFRLMQKGSKAREHQAAAEGLRAELHRLRNLPLQAGHAEPGEGERS